MNDKRVVIFGMGSLGQLLTEHTRPNVKIAAYLVSGGSGEFNGAPILSSPEELSNIDYDYVVIAFGNTPKGIEVLRKANIPEEKIVGYAYSGIAYENNVLQQSVNQTIDKEIKNAKVPELFDLPPKKYFICGMNVQENQDVIERDFVREQTLSFLAEEIHRRDIKGAVAEIGVSAGVFAKKINALFPDRTLYLYDTFNGLVEKDKKHALKLGWGEKEYALGEKGTASDIVLSKMPYPEKCVIKRGYFPYDFEFDEDFSFISLDIDFYNPIFDGLAKIYAKLSKGGYIMVHDFHNLAFPESRTAIIDFCEKNNAPYVPIPDWGGTTVIAR